MATLAELKSKATALDIKGRSKMSKAELEQAIKMVEGAALLKQIDAWMKRHDGFKTNDAAQDILDMVAADHEEALSMNKSAADKYSAKVVEQNRRRLAGYKFQNGEKPYGRRMVNDRMVSYGHKFTARQRRRMLKKAHHANAVWERMMASA